ncbi:MAG: hypothetical protein ACYC8T_18560 [Myxococcaceae bacterium]
MFGQLTRTELDRIKRMPTEADVIRLAEELERLWARRELRNDKPSALAFDVPQAYAAPSPGAPETDLSAT